ncbi:uncharacterized protein LOC141719606 [Apium graveolens]|uniref:uncharacterized protein LOC141719606 n=1 Tax=Apium graveolens TaxID=4045 RepID=UPI003D7B0C81
MVSSLISPDQNTWDTDLVVDIFNSRDSNIILSTPIDKEVDDSWYWRREKFGQYSVKSAYLMLEEGNPSNSSANNSGFWHTLWNLKIPPKVKNFLWRASNDCLPSREMLRTRNVQKDVVLRIVMVCWMVWRSRNELIWNQRTIDPNEVVLSAHSILDQWSNVQDRSYDQFLGYMTPDDGMERWSKPVENSVKINSDAAIFDEIIALVVPL